VASSYGSAVQASSERTSAAYIVLGRHRKTWDGVRQLAAERQWLKDRQRADRWQQVKSIRESGLGVIVVPLRCKRKHEVMLPRFLDMVDAGSGLDRRAREMRVSRGTVVRAYDFAHRAEAVAASREGRKPIRPPQQSMPKSRRAG